MIRDTSSARHIGLILLVYFVSFGPFSLVNVPFWDDWVLVQYGVDGLWELFQQVGRREHYFLTVPFVAFGNPMLWAAANFICWGIVPICVYVVLAKLGWSRGNAFWASILTAAAPLNQARFALAVTPYAFSAAFYSLGLVALIGSVQQRKVWLRVVAAILLACSLPTNSFLTMMLVAPVVVFLALRNLDPYKRLWPAVRGTLLHVELLLLPVAYWVIKTLFQQPYGLYEGYNKLRIGAVESLVGTFLAFIAQFPELWVFFPSWGHFYEAFAIAIVVVAVLAVLIRFAAVDVSTERGATKQNWLLAAALLGISLLALFPYVVVGIRPLYYALWESRHQTTFAIVAGVLVFVTLRAALPNRMIPASCLAVLLCFLALDLSASRQLLADVYDTNGLIHSPEIAKIPDGTLVGVFEDNRPYRMMMRHFQFYDLSSMLNANSPEKTLAAMSNYEVWDPDTDAYVLPGSEAFPRAVAANCQRMVSLPQYGAGDVISNGQFVEVALVPKSAPPGLLEGLVNAFGFIFNRQETIDGAVENLDVRVSSRPFTEASCVRPDSN